MILPTATTRNSCPITASQDGERLAGVGGGYQVAVPDGGHGDEAEEQILAVMNAPATA